MQTTGHDPSLEEPCCLRITAILLGIPVFGLYIFVTFAGKWYAVFFAIYMLATLLFLIISGNLKVSLVRNCACLFLVFSIIYTVLMGILAIIFLLCIGGAAITRDAFAVD